MKYNKFQYAYSIEKNSNLIISAILMLLLATSTASAAVYTIQEFGTDGFRYAAGANITVSGKILNDAVGESGADVTLELFDSSGTLINSYTATTDSTGYFSKIIQTTTLSSGRYTIVPSARAVGATAPGVNVRIYGAGDIKSITASFTRGMVQVVTLNETGYGDKIINGTQYYFFVSSSNTASVDDDPVINATEADPDGFNTIGSLITNSRVKLGNNTYSVFFVNRTSEIILARMVQPVFTGSEGYRNLTLLALNSSNYPLSGKNLLLNISNSSGVIETQILSLTGTDGLTTSNISIQSDSGLYTIQIMESGEALGTITYSVNSYDVAGDVLSSEWTSQHTFAKGQNATLAVSVKTTGGAIINNTQANVTAYMRGPGGFLEQHNLSFDSNRSLFNYVYQIPNDATQGTYAVEYVTTIGSQILRSFSSFEIRGYTIFLKPIGKRAAEMEGFFPGEEGYILVSGTDLTTGDIANINVLTSSSNRSNFTFSIKNSEGTDITGTWGVMSLNDFFDTAFVDPWLQNEIRGRAPNASVINFATPTTEAIYDARVTVNLNGTTEEAGTSVGVQSIFLYAFPVTNEGNFAMSVSTQDNVTLRIDAFNPKEMRSETNITSAGIVEAFAVDAAEMVTDNMRNPSLVTLPDGSKGLRFYNNDSNLGFHMVKFWANVTVDGNTHQAMGTGFFDVRLYYIWASPALTDRGNFMTYTGDSNISMRVQVMNTGFSPQSDKTVEVDEIRNGQTWEIIDFDKTSNRNWTGITDSNGIANISFNPSSSLKSGWYDVRIKLTADDASGNSISDYGRGWFEVRNFMFWGYPSNWNAKAGENISFTMQAVNSTDMNSPFNVSVRVSKVMVRTDWMQPPIEIGGTHLLNGSGSIDISTNMSRSATIIYNGTTNKSGMYEFVFEASTSSGIVEEARSWLEMRPFVAWVSLPRGNDWNTRFAVNGTVNLIIHASDTNNWGGNSIMLDATRTNITSVTKMGMFGGTPYKKQSDLNITNVTYDTSDTKAVNITLSLTNWAESDYDMVVNAVDINGNEVVTHFWIQVQVATVGLPQFYNMGIPENRMFTNKISFNLSDTPSEQTSDNRTYPELNYSIATNSKVGHDIKFMMQEWNEPQQQPFYALVNLTEPRRLYVNYFSANFSNNSQNPENMDVGGTFNEKNDTGVIVRRWNVTEIGADGTIRMEGIGALNNGYLIDTSISKSGNFIVETNFQDNRWMKVDLDGNGEYERWDWSTRNNTYYVILADNATSGVYDTVIVSNTTNFTRNGINAKNATSSDPVTFGGPPIYFISLKKEGASYNLAFTSYQAGFEGMWLGTFEKGRTLRVPFMVQYPGTSRGIPNVNVTVDRLTWYSPNFPDVVLSSVDAPPATTDSNGFAVINLNTTNISTGQYLISYRVTGLPGGLTKSPTEKWRLPGVEIRKFVVSAQAGSVGTISTRISDGSGLTVVYGNEIEPNGVASAYQYVPDVVYRVGWPFDVQNEYYYNATEGKYYTGFDWALPGTTGSTVENTNIILTRGSVNTTYNFTAFYPSGAASNTSLTVNVPQTVFGYWNMTLQSAGSRAQLRIDYLYDDMTPPPISQWYYNIGDRIYWGPGDLNIQITAINNTAVSFELFQPKILYQIENMNVLMDGINSNGEWESGRITKVSNYSGTGYDVYGYNDVNLTEIELQQQSGGWGWSPTLDRVLVANSTWNRTYRIGESIPVLNNQYVGLVARWGGKMIFVNSTYTRIFPFQDWAADGDSYYVGTFTESDVNADLNNNQNSTDSTTYYIRLEDNSPNGVFSVTSGMYDDDTDFTQAQSSTTWTPIDLYGQEGGYLEDMWSNRKFDEKWLTMDSMFGWPFGVPEITYSGNFANLTTFKQRWEPFGLSDNVTVYVNAKTFSNIPINGNVSLDKLTVLYKYNMSGGTTTTTLPGTGHGASISQMPGEGVVGGGGEGGGQGPGAPQSYTIPNVTAPIINGVGVWRINYSVLEPVVGSFDSGNFAAKLNISDNENNFETAEISFFMQNTTAFMAPPIGGGGGGTPPGGI